MSRSPCDGASLGPAKHFFHVDNNLAGSPDGQIQFKPSTAIYPDKARPVVTIGRSSRSANYVISKSDKLVSRLHASISYEWKDGVVKSMTITCEGWNGAVVAHSNKTTTLQKSEQLKIERHAFLFTSFLTIVGYSMSLEWKTREELEQEAQHYDTESEAEVPSAEAVVELPSSAGDNNNEEQPTSTLGQPWTYDHEPHLTLPSSPPMLHTTTPASPASSPVAKRIRVYQDENLPVEKPALKPLSSSSKDTNSRIPLQEIPKLVPKSDNITPGQTKKMNALLSPKAKASAASPKITKNAPEHQHIKAQEQPIDRIPTERNPENDTQAEPRTQSPTPKEKSKRSNRKASSTEQIEQAPAPLQQDLQDTPPLVETKQEPNSIDSQSSATSNLEQQTSELLDKVINALVFSTLSTTPVPELRALFPEDWSLDRIEQWLRETCAQVPVLGEIKREGKNAAGEKIWGEWYYTPEGDPSEERRDLLAPHIKPLRASRKSHKQYFWRRPGLPKRDTSWAAHEARGRKRK